MLRSLSACLDVHDLTAPNEYEPKRFVIVRIVIAVVLAAALLLRQEVATAGSYDFDRGCEAEGEAESGSWHSKPWNPSWQDINAQANAFNAP